MRRQMLDDIAAINSKRLTEFGDPETATRIAQYELAFKMQTSVPELMDTSSEPQHILDLYGAQSGDGTFASNCLLARRLVERGVRFVQLYHRGWDHHGGRREGHFERVAQTCRCLGLHSHERHHCLFECICGSWDYAFRGASPAWITAYERGS